MSPRAPRSSPNLKIDPAEQAGLPAAYVVLADHAKPLDWSAIFGCAGPVELEIGCGNGRFLAIAAPQNPDTLYFGIEISAKYALLAARRMDRWRISNARTAAAEANAFLDEYVAARSLSAAHIYFSDPWPKRRHARRRLFQYDFLSRLQQALIPGAPVFIRTDVDWYFADILTLLAEHPAFRIETYGEQIEFPEEELQRTGFESKALRQGRRVFHLTVRQGGTGKASV